MGRVCLELGVQGQGVGRILDVDGQGGWGGGVLKIGQFSRTSYVYYPSHSFAKALGNSYIDPL